MTQYLKASAVSHDGRTQPQPQLTVVQRKHIGRWIAAAITLATAIGIVSSLWTNPNLQIDVILQYLLSRPILSGVVTTIELTLIAMVIGLSAGLVLAVMRLSDNPVMASVSWVYTWFFRSIPPLVQLIFWAFLGALYEQIQIGVPFTGIVFVSLTTNEVLAPFMAAIVGLSIIEGAYAAEVIRGGIQSVSDGQVKAAEALGMTKGQTFRRVVLPQAMPAIIPPLGNNMIILLKATSLVSVIGGAELMTRTQNIYSQTFQVIPLLVVASMWYLAMMTVLTLAQAALESHYSKGPAKTKKRPAGVVKGERPAL